MFSTLYGPGYLLFAPPATPSLRPDHRFQIQANRRDASVLEVDSINASETAGEIPRAK